ncbi:MAG: dynamin family protein [Deltaproteobacteria bacterium]|nr:dynamin family protein [Deltaproteobacteria bacterium]
MIASIDRVMTMPGMSPDAFQAWKETCSTVGRQVEDDVIRVAVVGAIKSGKSTFINSIFKEDYLKRGAGVVTSIVTRARRGPYLKATLFFKSWDEINTEMQQALTLFPSSRWRAGEDLFDIRREADRRDLAVSLDSLNSEMLISEGARNVNSIVLDSYLKGYDQVRPIMASEQMTKVFEDDAFDGQRAFVGSDALAVYLKDIELEINNGSLDGNVEIADCQGSDSPNPLHLAMIQEYLVRTDLLIYVISSRTGLRQADIRFLSMIKQMGILENILFVVNCDLSEHESVADLSGLVERTGRELAMLKPQPEVFTLSSLLNLFRARQGKNTEKDDLRLSQWLKERALVEYSDRETERFSTVFQKKLARDRSSLLLANNIERLAVVAAGLSHWAGLNLDVADRDAHGVDEILEKIDFHRRRMDKIAAMVKSTLDGSVQKVKKEIRVDIDRFFDARHGSTMQQVVEFIRSYKMPMDRYEDNLTASGFTETLFLVFQDFKEALDKHLAEKVNPKIIRFVREEEQKIAEHLEAVAGPYESMVKEAVAEYVESMTKTGISMRGESVSGSRDNGLSAMRHGSDLKLPPMAATMRYSARIKTEAVVKLGVYAFENLIRKLLKKDPDGNARQKIRALEDGVKRMKRETERSVLLHLKDYRENIKFQYMYKLAGAMSDHLYKGLLERFEAYFADISTMVALIKEERIDKKGSLDSLQRVEKESVATLQRIDGLRERIGNMVADIGVGG